MLDSFEDFKSAVLMSLKDKISDRISFEREKVSNNLFRVSSDDAGNNRIEHSDEDSQSNSDEN